MRVLSVPRGASVDRGSLVDSIRGWKVENQEKYRRVVKRYRAADVRKDQRRPPTVVERRRESSRSEISADGVSKLVAVSLCDLLGSSCWDPSENKLPRRDKFHVLSRQCSVPKIVGCVCSEKERERERGGL